MSKQLLLETVRYCQCTPEQKVCTFNLVLTPSIKYAIFDESTDSTYAAFLQHQLHTLG